MVEHYEINLTTSTWLHLLKNQKCHIIGKQLKSIVKRTLIGSCSTYKILR